MTEQDILDLIEKDPWMMKVLQYAETLNLPDWMISAGFVRNKVWDELSDYKNQPHATDIDLIYFDPNGNNEKKDEALTTDFKNKTGLDWEIVNQIYTRDWNTELPYTSAEDALAHFPETATAVAVTLVMGKPKLIAPYGIVDLANMVVRPSPKFSIGAKRVKERVEQKNWLTRWPKLTLAY